MPNTLAHLGTHTLLGRYLPGIAARQPGDLLWLWLGCVLPDLPWILQRVAKQFIDGEARYALRLFFVSQATLLGCIVLSAAVSMLAKKRGRVFALLSASSVLHLLFDSVQIKWGNGPHFFAPISWWTPPGWIWPESPWTWLWVASGIVVGLLFARQALSEPVVLDLSFSRLLSSSALFGLWCISAGLLAPLAEANDVHGIATLRDSAQRPGRTVELYNAHWQPAGDGSVAAVVPEGRLLTMTSEALVAKRLRLVPPARVSIRGRFVTPKVLEVTEFHQHRATRRDLLSYLGLAWVAFVWAWTQRKALSCWSPSRPEEGPRVG